MVATSVWVKDARLILINSVVMRAAFYLTGTGWENKPFPVISNIHPVAHKCHLTQHAEWTQSREHSGRKSVAMAGRLVFVAIRTTITSLWAQPLFRLLALTKIKRKKIPQ